MCAEIEERGEGERGRVMEREEGRRGGERGGEVLPSEFDN